MQKGTHHSLETRAKMRASHLKDKNHNWKGGRYIGTQGYIHILQEDGSYQREHRAIAESVLGRKLKPEEVVHHIDGDKTNNSFDNLLVCTQSFHLWLDRRMAQLYRELHGPTC